MLHTIPMIVRVAVVAFGTIWLVRHVQDNKDDERAEEIEFLTQERIKIGKMHNRGIPLHNVNLTGYTREKYMSLDVFDSLPHNLELVHIGEDLIARESHIFIRRPDTAKRYAAVENKNFVPATRSDLLDWYLSNPQWLDDETAITTVHMEEVMDMYNSSLRTIEVLHMKNGRPSLESIPIGSKNVFVLGIK